MVSDSTNIIKFPKKNRSTPMPNKPMQPDDWREWFFKYRLRNGLEGCYPISASEKEYLWNRVQEDKIDNAVNSSLNHRMLCGELS